MAIVDGWIQPSYLYKSLIKILFFLIIPCFVLRQYLPFLKSLVIPTKQGLCRSLILGFVLYCLILAGYGIVSQFYDFSTLTTIINHNVGVNKDNFLYVSLYISFCNSFLEEFFFRGIAFIGLKQYIPRKYAYLISAFAFAIYHVALMDGWFSLGLLILMIVGLMIGGYLFNILDEKSETIYASWMVHMFANFSINTIGFFLFGLIS